MKKETSLNLENFVSEVLNQIISGIKKSQNHAIENSAAINSNRLIRSQQGDLRIDISNRGPIFQEVEFDIAVTVSAQGNIKGGMGVFVQAAGIGYQAEKETGNSTVSRIKFKIPVTFPTQE